MNLEEFGSAAQDVPISTEGDNVADFLSHYKKQVKDHSSIFEHAYTQKIVSETQLNWTDYDTPKYLQFSLNVTEHLTQMNSLLAHISVQLLEIMPDGTYQELKENETARIGLIPG